jgi:hypothetical protein
MRPGHHPSQAGLFITGERFIKGVKQKTFSQLLVANVIKNASKAAVSEKEASQSGQPAGWTSGHC